MPRLRLPPNLADYLATRRWLTPILFAILATTLAMLAQTSDRFGEAVQRFNHAVYDSFFRVRPTRDMRKGNVVIVTVDEKSIDEAHVMNEETGQRKPLDWPWPRDIWVDVINCISAGKPKAIAFDLLFDSPSRFLGGDDALADAIDEAKVPLIFAAMIQDDGRPKGFAPPAKAPVLGAVNMVPRDDDKGRVYMPFVNGAASLGVQALLSAGVDPASIPSAPFPLRYYGKHQRSGGSFTFEYISAWNVAVAGGAPERAADVGIDPSIFRDKYVLIGISAPGHDMGPTPLDHVSPRVELHAIAIENILRGDRVIILGGGWTLFTALLASLAGSFSASMPRRMMTKVLLSGLVVAALITISGSLFMANPIRWLPIAAALVALIASVIFALGWSYGVEDKQARIYLKALSQVISPAVADNIRRDPAKLKLGGERRNMTVMFSDIAGFTDLSEAISVEQLTDVLNHYLHELSKIVFQADGTLDKYIGDAIMSFWNAPLDQPDHALRACRTALAMIQRENEIQPELQRRGAGKLLTRIGINTGDMAVGNLGSDFKFSYTVIGDSVNLAARLEGSNKLYGTQICLAHATAELVKGEFLLRKLDMLRVKGKKQPMAVYELMADGSGTEKQRDIAGRYEQGFRFYQSQNWDEAERIWLDLLRDHGHDGPSEKMLARIAKYREEAPEPDWDGVYVAKDK